jgi:hypothetical protein
MRSSLSKYIYPQLTKYLSFIKPVPYYSGQLLIPIQYYIPDLPT